MAENKATAARAAREALKAAEEAERQEMNDKASQTETDRVNSDMKAQKDNAMKQQVENATLEGDLGDSKRQKVIVSRKYGNAKHKIFSCTVIMKNGRPTLEQFRVPVNVEVTLPVEIIEQLKGRKVAKWEDGKQIMATEFTVEKVD